jgi:peptidoglycan/LPS O-acetylase OafA/YrhL
MQQEAGAFVAVQPASRPRIKLKERGSSMTKYAGLPKRLLVLNGLAILAVILYHASIWAFLSMSRVAQNFDGSMQTFKGIGGFLSMSRTAQNFDQIGALTYYSLRAVEQAIIFAIAAFLFISGYFIAFAVGRIEANKQWRVIFTRIKNLVIPFLIWSVLILVLDMLLGNTYSVRDFLLTIITGKARIPYYFIPLLVQYLILSPILVSLARTRYKLLLILTALIQLITVSLRYDTLLGLNTPALQPILFIRGQPFFPSRIFFFTFGIVYGLHSSQFKQKLIRVRWGLLVSLVVFFILGVVEWEILQRFSGEISIGQTETHIDGFYALAFILCFLAFEEFIPPFSEQLGILGAMSYGIYLIHWSVQEYVSKMIYHFSPWLMGYQVFVQPILIVCSVGLPVILMTLVKRSPIRRYYRYLFG